MTIPMLPHMRRRWLAIVASAVLAATTAGCDGTVDPEARVRAVVAAGETAAEARDLGELMALVSRDFRDGQGQGREELRQYLRGYLVTHPSVHVLTRIESVEFPYRDLARVRLTVGLLGRESADAAEFDLAADVQDVVLELRLEGDEWRVVRHGGGSSRRD
jgi:hypothetical protein